MENFDSELTEQENEQNLKHRLRNKEDKHALSRQFRLFLHWVFIILISIFVVLFIIIMVQFMLPEKYRWITTEDKHFFVDTAILSTKDD